MSPAFAVFIMMNNYFHDVATAMIIASAVIMTFIIRLHEQTGGRATAAHVRSVYMAMKNIVAASLLWITVSAIPRILTFTSFEWLIATQKDHSAGLLVKHIIMFVILISGVMLWIRIIKKMKTMMTQAS